MERIEELEQWVDNMSKKDIDHCDSAFGNSFGYITLKNGKKAQIQISLELDEDCWI